MWALWDGCDVMSTEKAIYSPFVLLRSFKKANSLRAWKQARWGGGGGGGWGGLGGGVEIDPPRLPAPRQVDRAD